MQKFDNSIFSIKEPNVSTSQSYYTYFVAYSSFYYIIN